MLRYLWKKNNSIKHNRKQRSETKNSHQNKFTCILFWIGQNKTKENSPNVHESGSFYSDSDEANLWMNVAEFSFTFF